MSGHKSATKQVNPCVARDISSGQSAAMPILHRPKQTLPAKYKVDKNQSCLKQEATRGKKQVGCGQGSGGDAFSQGDVNMNKQIIPTLTGLGQVEASQLKVTRGDRPADLHAVTEDAQGSVEKCQKVHKVRPSSSPFVKAKTQMKKLVHHKTRKIKVFEPVDSTGATSECSKNINIIKTASSGLVDANYDKLRKVDVNRHRKPVETVGKDNPVKKKTKENRIDKNVRNAELSALKKSTSAIAADSSSCDELQNSKYEKPNFVNSREGAAICDKHNGCIEINSQEKETEELNTGSENIHTHGVMKSLPKQRTFLIEKPKLAWGSPVLSSRGFPMKTHVVDSSSESSLASNPAQMVTSLHSIHTDTDDAGQEEMYSKAPANEQHSIRPHASVRSSAAVKQNQLLAAAATTRLQTYSDPVMDNLLDVCVDSGEGSDEDAEGIDTCDDVKIINNGTHGVGEENFQKQQPTTADNCDTLSWVLAKSDKEVSIVNSNRKKFAKKDISTPSKDASAGYDNDVKKVKSHKLSRFKQLKKSFAKLPKELSDNLYNILPSSSRFMRLRDARENRMDTVKQVTVGKKSQTDSKLTNGEAETGINKVLMRHATTLTSKEI